MIWCRFFKADRMPIYHNNFFCVVWICLGACALVIRAMALLEPKEKALFLLWLPAFQPDPFKCIVVKVNPPQAAKCAANEEPGVQVSYRDWDFATGKWAKGKPSLNKLFDSKRLATMPTAMQKAQGLDLHECWLMDTVAIEEFDETMATAAALAQVKKVGCKSRRGGGAGSSAREGAGGLGMPDGKSAKLVKAGGSSQKRAASGGPSSDAVTRQRVTAPEGVTEETIVAALAIVLPGLKDELKEHVLREVMHEVPFMVRTQMGVQREAAVPVVESKGKWTSGDCYYMKTAVPKPGHPQESLVCCNIGLPAGNARYGVYLPKSEVHKAWLRHNPGDPKNNFHMTGLYDEAGVLKGTSPLSALGRCKICIATHDKCTSLSQKLVVRKQAGEGNCGFCRETDTTLSAKGHENWLCSDYVTRSAKYIERDLRDTLVVLFDAVSEVTGHDITVSKWNVTTRTTEGTVYADFVVSATEKGSTMVTHTLWLEFDRDHTLASHPPDRNSTISAMNHLLNTDCYKAMIRMRQYGSFRIEGGEVQNYPPCTRYVLLRDWYVTWLRSTAFQKEVKLVRDLPVTWLMYMFYDHKS